MDDSMLPAKLKVLHFFKKVTGYFLYSNLFIATCAVAFTIQSYWQVNEPVQYDNLLWIVFFGTLFTYLMHREVSLGSMEDSSLSPRMRWLQNNRLFSWFLMALSFTGITIIFFIIDINVKRILIFLAVVVFLYAYPVIKKKRLREVGILKIFYIAFIWTMVTAILPMVNMNYNVFSGEGLLLSAERFLFIFAITLPFDLRDMEYDKEAGLTTIPMMIGERKTYGLSFLVLLLFAGVCALHYLYVQQMTGIFIAMVISAVFTGYFIYLGIRKEIPFYYLGILDGMMIVQFLLTGILKV